MASLPFNTATRVRWLDVDLGAAIISMRQRAVTGMRASARESVSPCGVAALSKPVKLSLKRPALLEIAEADENNLRTAEAKLIRTLPE